MTKQNLRKQLALTLEIPEESILQTVRYGDHYTVITTTCQKFTEVHPAPEPVAEVVEAPATENVEEIPETSVTPTEIENPPVAELVEVPVAELVEVPVAELVEVQPDFPPELQLAWNNPRAARVIELRELADGLGIETTTKMKKAQLVNAIIAYKLNYYE